VTDDDCTHREPVVTWAGPYDGIGECPDCGWVATCELVFDDFVSPAEFERIHGHD
jgi:hypothetical protein